MAPAQRTREEWIEVLRRIGATHLSDDDPAVLYDLARAHMGHFVELGGLQDGDTVVDVGSGTGRFAIPLTERNLTYVGLEPMKATVDACNQAFEPWDNIRFQHLDVRNSSYNPDGSMAPDEVRFPLPNECADEVIFASVFTHLETIEICRHYLEEAWRILKPGKYCGCSWFRSPPHVLRADAGKTVLLESDIIEAIKPWKCLYTRAGTTGESHDQWDMLLQKPA